VQLPNKNINLNCDGCFKAIYPRSSEHKQDVSPPRSWAEHCKCLVFAAFCAWHAICTLKLAEAETEGGVLRHVNQLVLDLNNTKVIELICKNCEEEQSKWQ